MREGGGEGNSGRVEGKMWGGEREGARERFIC